MGRRTWGAAISIHSLRMEGDRYTVTYCQYGDISIHSLRMEGDQRRLFCNVRSTRFQSTPSAWRETFWMEKVKRSVLFQSTPSAWRETGQKMLAPAQTLKFQSTPSAWRETVCLGRRTWGAAISIHSLRMEGDVIAFYFGTQTENFNPLPPHGGRPALYMQSSSTSFISIHSLRMEGDRKRNRPTHRDNIFQSTPSAWRETTCGRDSLRH